MKSLRWFKPILGKRKYQEFFRKMHLFALYGMNYGRSGDVEVSGEKQVVDLVHKEFQDVDHGIFLDCGANIGEYSMALVKGIGGNSKLYAFEPGSTTFAQLSENTKLYKNIIPVPKGVGDQPGQFSFFASQADSKHSSFIQRDMSHWDEKYNLKKSETVELIRLDAFLASEKIRHVQFIKIDIEGYEMNCLLGLGDFLKNREVDMIQFEFGVATIDAKCFFKDFYYLLSPDYHLYRILKKGFFPITKYNEVLEVFITTNYLAVSKSFVPKSKIG
jgi:FkbM family methyltransferase